VGPGLHGARGDAEHRRRLLLAQALDVAQHQHRPVLRLEAGQSGPDVEAEIDIELDRRPGRAGMYADVADRDGP
jgi:hypothetical protein